MKPERIGDEFFVVSSTGAEQRHNNVTGLSDGGFVITWADRSPHPNYNIKAQVFQADGSPLNNDFAVNTTTEISQFDPAVTGVSDGGFVITWDGAIDRKARGQEFDEGGNPVRGEFTVEDTDSRIQQHESNVAGLADGGFVVTWSGVEPIPNLRNVHSRVFDAEGNPVGGELLVNTTTEARQWESSVASLSDGGFVVTWSDRSGAGGPNSNGDVQSRLFDANGSPVTGEFLVNTTTEWEQRESSVAALSDGGFVVTWSDWSGSGGPDSNRDILGQVFDADGTTVGGEILVNTETDGFQYNSSVAALPDDGFIVTWTTGGFGSSNIRGQVFDASADPVGDAFPVNTMIDGTQSNSNVASLLDGEFVVTWDSNPGIQTTNTIKGQKFSRDPEDSPLDPVYRFFNEGAGGHFYTPNSEEAQFVRDNLGYMNDEGVGFYAFEEEQEGAAPIFRFFNEAAGGHFYTPSAKEAQFVRDNLDYMNDEGVGFYAFGEEQNAAVPVYRFFNEAAGGHFYTPSAEEAQFVRDNLDYMNDEGVGFYAYADAFAVGSSGLGGMDAELFG